MVKLRGLPLPTSFIPRTIFGNWALVPEKPILFKQKHVKVIRLLLTMFKKKHKILIPYENRLFIGITKKPKGVRMGGGKGKVVDRAALVRAGRVIVETESDLPPLPFKKMQSKLDFPTRICRILPGQVPTPNSEFCFKGGKGGGPNPVRYSFPRSPLKWFRETVLNYSGHKTARGRRKELMMEEMQK
ncbi:hypothetical protein LOD99_15657 [Oopsacas minuta]|uniref:Uncharacterized protein n=1 Tax=Oopsacas minuta TaxID=111878 RepID=A0AAV7KB51_9METZ|nr:hypothetical protein LOD99_15657 [Oopsacas minuta]